jgi:hypothetical protein
MIALIAKGSTHASRVRFDGFTGRIITETSVKGNGELFPYVERFFPWNREASSLTDELILSLEDIANQIFREGEFDITCYVGVTYGLNFVFHVCNDDHNKPTYLLCVGQNAYVNEQLPNVISSFPEAISYLTSLLKNLEAINFSIDSFVDEATQSFSEEKFLSVINHPTP